MQSPSSSRIVAGNATDIGHAYACCGGGLHGVPGAHSIFATVAQPVAVLNSDHDVTRGSGGVGTGWAAGCEPAMIVGDDVIGGGDGAGSLFSG